MSALVWIYPHHGYVPYPTLHINMIITTKTRATRQILLNRFSSMARSDLIRQPRIPAKSRQAVRLSCAGDGIVQSHAPIDLVNGEKEKQWPFYPFLVLAALSSCSRSTATSIIVSLASSPHHRQSSARPFHNSTWQRPLTTLCSARKAASTTGESAKKTNPPKQSPSSLPRQLSASGGDFACFRLPALPSPSP